MDFQRKQIPFLHQGLNWNSPVEKLKDGQVCWAKNVRVLKQGTVSSAHGMTTLFTQIPALYLHSFSRLNILNETDDASGGNAFDQWLRRTYVMGADGELYVFQDVPGVDTLHNPALNPVQTPQGLNGFSGNPLSIVDAQPAGAAVAWKYIGDSLQNVTVGYYPGDHMGSTMARCFTMGLDPPVNNPQLNLPSIAGSGNLGNYTDNTGAQVGADYQWVFAYRRVQTGARSNPSAATRQRLTSPALHCTFQDVQMHLPQVPIDPQTGNYDANVVVDVYRFGSVINRWALVGSGPGGSLFVDNISDESILAAPAPPQATDAATGLTRFNMFRPFVTQDIERSGRALLTLQSNGTYILDAADANRFNPRWLPGSTIYLTGPAGGTGVACTIYQVLTNTVLEIADNLGGPNTPVIPSGDFVTWKTNAGTLMAGQPLPHIWGPYGIGQSGMYIFGCGDHNARGTLYWTNGNDPDSTDVVNNIIVTSPSEKLVTGCIYDGQPYVWSTERQFQIFPSLTIFGQFTSQEVAGAKGVWLEWSLSVQSNGVADQSVSWRGKDGIYDWSTQGLQRLTDPLYPFFPHDNNPGLAPETIMPFINSFSHHPEHVGNLDDTLVKYHRLCWFQGLLYYDFVCQAPASGLPLQEGVPTWSTLVWDSVNIPGGGWVSLDQPFAVQGNPNALYPACRSVDIGANDPVFDATIQPGPIYGPMARGGSMKVLWAGSVDGTGGGTIFDYYGYTRSFESRFITRAEDLGDSRLLKLWGDYWIDGTPLPNFTVYPLVSFNSIALQPKTVPFGPYTPGVRMQFPVDFAEFTNTGGKGLLGPTLGLDIIWVGDSGQFVATLNQWEPTFVIKPDLIEFRATDRSDQGATQAKYLMGANIEADTREMVDPNTGLPNPTPMVTQTVQLNVIIDGNIVATLNLWHPGQTIKPYAWEPVAGYEFQVQFQFETAATLWWQLYKINWIFQPWPDAVARKYPFQNLGSSGAKYIRGIVMPMETAGVPGTVNLWGDDADTNYTWTKTTEYLKKTGEVLDLPAPFTAHEIQFTTLPDAAGNGCRIWPDEVKVDFDPWPESSTDVSSFTDLGYNGAKFMQGAVIPMETSGRPTSLTIRNECNQYVKLPAVQTPTNCKQSFAFSFSPCYNPPSDVFIAHEIQVSPGSDARIWYDEIKWIWEPEPELVPSWVTQPTDHDFATWHHHRDCFIAYRGGNGTPVLYITTEYGTEAYPLDPVVSNQYVRSYRVLKPQKAKWRSYRVEGCGLFRLYIKDSVVRVKEWGATGPYLNAQPFGDLSRTNGAPGGARI